MWYQYMFFRFFKGGREGLGIGKLFALWVFAIPCVPPLWIIWCRFWALCELDTLIEEIKMDTDCKNKNKKIQLKPEDKSKLKWVWTCLCIVELAGSKDFPKTRIVACTAHVLNSLLWQLVNKRMMGVHYWKLKCVHGPILLVSIF